MILRRIHKAPSVFLLLLILAGVSAPLLSQKVATTSMQFLKVMPVARATAMGDAFTALSDGAEAVYWNPAGVARASGIELSSTYVDWIFDTQQGAISGVMPIEMIGTFGVQLQYVDYGVFDEAIADYSHLSQSVSPGLTGRQFRPFSYLIGVTYGRSLTDKFSTGLSVKYVHESLFDLRSVSVTTPQGNKEDVNTYANGILFDFGLLYETGYRTIRIAAVIQNFGASVSYAKESDPAPLLFRLGMAADLIGTNSLFVEAQDIRLTGAFDLFQPNDYTQQMHAGVELEYANAFALRAGYKFNYDEEGLALGGGVRQELAGVRLTVDYSYSSLGEYLEMAHRLTIGAGL